MENTRRKGAGETSPGRATLLHGCNYKHWLNGQDHTVLARKQVYKWRIIPYKVLYYRRKQHESSKYERRMYGRRRASEQGRPRQPATTSASASASG